MSERGHVPGAINPPQADLPSCLDELPRDCSIATICQSGFRSLRAAQFLKQRGYDDVANVKGGTKAWQASGKLVATAAPTNAQPLIVDSEWTHADAASDSI